VATAFWVDEEFDRQHGPGGNGRYGAAVREWRDDFADVWGDISPVGFAVTAWALAVGLEPGFVRCHRRIISAACRRNSWDGGLTCAVTIVAPWPAELPRPVGNVRSDRTSRLDSSTVNLLADPPGGRCRGKMIWPMVLGFEVVLCSSDSYAS
jgi:hypothetical protein